MREGWTYKKLGEICSCITKGTTPTSLGFSFEEQGISFVKVESFTEEGSLLKDKVAFISEECNNALKRSQLEEDDILFSIAGAIGRVAIVPKDILPANTNQALAIVRLREKEKLTLLYLKYLLSSSYIKHQTNFYKAGVAQQNLSLGQLSSLQIPLPPKSQQEAIVSELDEINSLLALKREQLQKYDKLAQSLFYEMFGDPVENEKGWEVKELSTCVDEMFLGPFGSALKVECYVPKEQAYAMVYEQKHAIQGTLDLENHFITEEKFNSLSRFEVLPGDFIMSCRGTIGKIYQLPDYAAKGIIHPSLMKIRIKNDVYSPTYFVFMLRKIVANETTNGNCVQMAITAKELGKKYLPLPPLPLQQQFASRIEQIEEQKKQVTAAIERLETLLASRTQYWFE